MAERSGENSSKNRKKAPLYVRNRAKRRRRDRRRRLLLRSGILFLILSALCLTAFFVVRKIQDTRYRDENRRIKEAEIQEEEDALQYRREQIALAESMAESYDYDGAIALLKSVENYESDADIIDAIASFTAEKSELVAVDVTQVPHIFFHSLIIDTDRAFDTEKWSAGVIGGTNAWMTTLSEFDKIIQQMYDNGYVLVRMRDLVTETLDENGNIVFEKNTSLMLPPDKKAYVLSVDDWSYYHSYDGKGYADKAVLDENGDVKCQYTDASGQVSVGDYDVVPRLNTFLEEHPDACYKGARGMIAMTGYNGVFGYRTDIAYKTGENLDEDQQQYLDAHPDFSYEEEVENAKQIAEAVKESGWEFACHTWGHLSVTDKSLEELQADLEKWKSTVQNIVGETDIIIFAHGNDIGSWRDYDAETNPVYAYYKSEGYRLYANVDASTKCWVQIRSDYIRQGRIDCDGLQMWRALSGAAKTNVFEDLFDVESVFDPARPTPVEAIGKA